MAGGRVASYGYCDSFVRMKPKVISQEAAFSWAEIVARVRQEAWQILREAAREVDFDVQDELVEVLREEDLRWKKVLQDEVERMRKSLSVPERNLLEAQEQQGLEE